MNIIKKTLALCVTVLGLGFIQYDAAAQEAPDALVMRIAQEVLDAAKSDKNIQAGNQKHVRELVDSKIVPHVDFERMTALTAGPQWEKATPDQQKQLTNEFRALIIHTYSGALSNIRNQKVVLEPMRAPQDSNEAEVKTEITQPNHEPIQLAYRLEKTPEGWKIYDISVLGAWLVQTYKNTFLSQISQGGFDGLIKTLADKNRNLTGNTTGAS
jgi:phospholipid transport system substrate-binding protein